MIDFITAAKKRLQAEGRWGEPQTAEEIRKDSVAESNDLQSDINQSSDRMEDTVTTINIPNTTLVITIERVLDESNEPTDSMLCLVKDTSVPEPEFNPITFLEDVSYNVVARQFFTA